MSELNLVSEANVEQSVKLGESVQKFSAYFESLGALGKVHKDELATVAGIFEKEIKPILNECAEFQDLEIVQEAQIKYQQLCDTLETYFNFQDMLYETLQSHIDQEFGQFDVKMGMTPELITQDMNCHSLDTIMNFSEEIPTMVKRAKQSAKIHYHGLFDYLKTSENLNLRLTLKDLAKAEGIELAHEVAKNGFNQTLKALGFSQSDGIEIDAVITYGNSELAKFFKVDSENKLVLFKAQMITPPQKWDFVVVPKDRLPDSYQNGVFKTDQIAHEHEQPVMVELEVAEGVRLPVDLSMHMLITKLKKVGA